MHFPAAAALFFLPFFAYAADFSSSALFLSKSSVTEGETVLIHAVVSNDTSAAFNGELSFKGGETIGSTTVVLNKGEARTVSVSWTPSSGSHTITAELRAEDEEVVATERATFTIKEKPVVAGTSTSSTPVESSGNIQKTIANVSPQLASGAAPVLNSLDSWRQSGADFLDEHIEEAEKRLPQGGVLGAAATENATSNPMGAAGNVFQTLYFYLLTVLRFILASAALFYPLLAILFLYALWRLYRRMSPARY